MKIIDSHIHIFDINRKLVWPDKKSLIYRSFLPESYEFTAKKWDIVGAVIIEASPFVQDNDWVLEQINNLPFFKGFIGNLDLNSLDFKSLLDRYNQCNKFLGIRLGNLWQRNLKEQMKNRFCFENLTYLNSKGLILELANPNLELLITALELKKNFENQVLVLNHLPNLKERKDALPILQELASIPSIYIKFSEIAQIKYKDKRFHLERYKDFLDFLWELFTPHKILFGSDYPNSEFLGSFEEIISLVKAYLLDKTIEEQELVWYENANKIYRSKNA